jgi:hypothetical protein
MILFFPEIAIALIAAFTIIVVAGIVAFAYVEKNR